MAIYIFNLNNFTIEKLIAAQGRSILSFAWCPNDSNLLASASGDGTVILWNIKDECVVKEAIIGNHIVLGQVDWCPQDPTRIAIQTTAGEVYLWNTVTVEPQKVKLIYKGDTTAMRFCQKGSTARLALGTQSGRVLVLNVDDGNRIVAMPTPVDLRESIYVHDVRWDPCSSAYLLVLYSDGRLLLFDTETAKIAMEFDQQKRTSGIAWNPFVPGQFFTISTLRASIDVWNVSQKTMSSRYKLNDKQAGALTIEVSAQTPHVFVSLSDGSIAFFDSKSKRTQFVTQPGHWETIFDCKFKPHDTNVIATASFDGSIKIWDVVTGEFRLEMNGRHGCIYAISWDAATPASSLLASAAVDGTIDIWDTGNGTLLRSLQHHEQPCFRLCWNPRNSAQIVSTSSDGTAVVFSPIGSIQTVLRHPEAVYGCDFNPFNENLLVTGCHDGIVRIFDLAMSTNSPICELRGHRQRVFNTIWSPLLPNTLASGSDDKTIRVWNTTTQTSTVFEGHHDRVRALVWNPEIPFLLISGSWDATIRVWDTRSATCISVVQDHQSDIYGLTTHSLRPFLVVSSSRDTSLRFWNLDEDVVTRLFLASAIDLREGFGRLRDKAENVMSNTAGNRIMCGSASLAVQKLLHSPQATTLMMASVISQFFSFSAGTEYLWRLSDTVTNGAVSTDCPILHYSQIRNSILNRAKALDKTIAAPLGRARHRELLLQQAELLLKAGQLTDYCKIMIGLGEWQKAICIAPGISFQYWRELCQQYANQLAAESNIEAVPFLLATGDRRQAVNFYEQLGDIESAVAVAACGIKVSSSANCDSCNHSTTSESHADLIEDVVRSRAAQLFVAGEAILAACHYLSISQVSLAIDKLLAGCEFLTAFVLARALDPNRVKRSAHFVLKMAERLQMWNEIDAICDISALPASDRLSLYLRYSGDKPIEAFCKEKGIRIPDLKDGVGKSDLYTQLRWMIFSRKYNDAVNLGLLEIKNRTTGNHWSFESCWKVIEILHNADAVQLEERNRVSLLCYCSYFGGIMAHRRGFSSVSAKLFENTRTFLNKYDWLRNDFPVEDIVIAMQQLLRMSNQESTAGLAKAILASSSKFADVTKFIHQAAESILKEFESNARAGKQSEANEALIPSYTRIPSARHSKFPMISSITGRIIHGVPFSLPDGNACVERSEAMMWAMVNPFSPLNSGKRVNPF